MFSQYVLHRFNPFSNMCYCGFGCFAAYLVCKDKCFFRLVQIFCRFFLPTNRKIAVYIGGQNVSSSEGATATETPRSDTVVIR